MASIIGASTHQPGNWQNWPRERSQNSWCSMYTNSYFGPSWRGGPGERNPPNILRKCREWPRPHRVLSGSVQHSASVSSGRVPPKLRCLSSSRGSTLPRHAEAALSHTRRLPLITRFSSEDSAALEIAAEPVCPRHSAELLREFRVAAVLCWLCPPSIRTKKENRKTGKSGYEEVGDEHRQIPVRRYRPCLSPGGVARTLRTGRLWQAPRGLANSTDESPPEHPTPLRARSHGFRNWTTARRSPTPR